ncbi:MAG: SRPBCC family protein [Bacillota bacterium]
MDDQSFQLNAREFVLVTPQQAWQVLTDYEHLTEFVPDLVHSRVLSRSRHEATVEQVSRTGLLLLAYTVQVVVHIEERPYSAIDVALVSGDLRHYRAYWTLAESSREGARGTLITYCGELAPKFYLPPAVGQPLVQAQVRKMVAAVSAEIEQRARH